MRISRRNALSAMAMGALGISHPVSLRGQVSDLTATFRYCLNTSTISGKNPGLLQYIEIASTAGYDGIEVWVRDVEEALKAGHTLTSLKQFIDDHGIQVESAIGFAPWMTGGEAGIIQMEREMQMLAAIGCKRIAAPPAGVPADKPLDLFAVGEKYSELLKLGRLTGVMPQLEFWGSSPALWHLGQVLMIAAVADDPDVKILPDVYHMFRGGSGFNALKMLNGKLIDLFHMNDYPDNKPREDQVDADRVYPGDGAAPMHQILTDLKNMGGEKVLSLELFNRSYWEEDPLSVARIGLAKMKAHMAEIA
ncbi:MAG: sugar phosphate isomerase/epimerase family protein [Bacteroidota bacterium]|nr:sugar phosphate isomerase/epimerase family protein [Bacteroidota bacterium]